MILSRHRAEVPHLPEHPLDAVQARAPLMGDEPAGLVGEVDQDRARFEHRQRRSAIGRRLIDDAGDAVVGRDLQECRSELLALADVHRMDRIRQSRFLEEDGDLVAVGRRPVIEIDHKLVAFKLMRGQSVASGPSAAFGK